MMGSAGSECGRRLSVLALAILFACTLSPGVSAEEGAQDAGIPRAMLYEGYVTDEIGQALPDGPYDFRFSLYEAPTGGTPVWTEEHLGVEVIGGVVQVRLGEGTAPAPLDIPFDVQYYLGIQLGEDAEMFPRLRLMTSAYAFRAGVADDVRDASITGEKLAPLSVADEHIASVSWEKITDVPDESDSEHRGGEGGSSVPSNVWHTKGNRKTDSSKDYVGTSDEVALNLATYDSVRLQIGSDGRIAIDKELEVGDYITSRKSENEGGFLLADPDHGMKRVGNDDLHLYTTGGNLLLEGGNVGIGTASPTAALHVVSTTGGVDDDLANYPLLLETASQGMAIQVVGDSDVDADNNYISFWDEGVMKGRIEGEDAVDVLTSWDYWYFTRLDAMQLAGAITLLAGATGDGRACPPICFCPPGFAPIVAHSLNVAAQAGRMVMTQVTTFLNLGVSYESSSGDYAEWLERLDPHESIGPGDVIGVFGGKISKSTDGAEQLMVISSSPIVVGNMPAEGTEHLYTKVAFVGQVPVKVVGPVKAGDYIIPSGLGDGTGVAVPSSLMTAKEYSRIVGRAWSSSTGEFPTIVTVAVGMSQGDVAEVVWRQQVALDALRAENAAKDADMAGVRAELDDLRNRVGGLSGLLQELVTLRATMAETDELVPAASLPSDDSPTSAGGGQAGTD